MGMPPQVQFAGYASEAGGHLIQDWFDGLKVEERDEIKDTLNYLVSIPVTDWRRPEVDKVASPIVEIRCKATKVNHMIRLYGVFDGNVRARFIILHATESKKKGSDQTAQKLALKRMASVNSRKASTHEFSFQERTPEQNQERSGE
jgi:hypothetical protein